MREVGFFPQAYFCQGSVIAVFALGTAARLVSAVGAHTAAGKAARRGALGRQRGEGLLLGRRRSPPPARPSPCPGCPRPGRARPPAPPAPPGAAGRLSPPARPRSHTRPGGEGRGRGSGARSELPPPGSHPGRSGRRPHSPGPPGAPPRRGGEGGKRGAYSSQELDLVLALAPLGHGCPCLSFCRALLPVPGRAAAEVAPRGPAAAAGRSRPRRTGLGQVRGRRSRRPQPGPGCERGAGARAPAAGWQRCPAACACRGEGDAINRGRRGGGAPAPPAAAGDPQPAPSALQRRRPAPLAGAPRSGGCARLGACPGPLPDPLSPPRPQPRAASAPPGASGKAGRQRACLGTAVPQELGVMCCIERCLGRGRTKRLRASYFGSRLYCGGEEMEGTTWHQRVLYLNHPVSVLNPRRM